MPATRNDEENLARYMKRAVDFMDYETENIESLESIATARNTEIPKDVAEFISFFKQQLYVHDPKCLIELYTALLACEKEWGAIHVANVFDFTMFKFRRYAKILKERRVL